jgi:hypothetical protein
VKLQLKAPQLAYPSRRDRNQSPSDHPGRVMPPGRAAPYRARDEQPAQLASTRADGRAALPELARSEGSASMSNAQDKTQTAGYAEAGAPRASHGGGGHGVAQSGFTVLAATLMILSGLWSFLEGLVAIIRQSFFTALPNYSYQFSVHGWGWIHLALGIVIFAAGACVLLGQAWALMTGIVLAVFSGVANFMFLPYYPLWAIILIAIDVFVIWALATGLSRRAMA